MSFKYENEILVAALDEFSSKNYDEASLNTIIKKSGISKGSFYHHFKNKYDIYIHLLRDAFTKKWEFINSGIKQEENPTTTGDIFSILSEQINIGITFGEKYPKYSALARKLAQEKKNPVYEKVIKDMELDANSGLESLIIKSIKNGQFCDQFSDEFIMKMMNFFFTSYHDILTDYNLIDSFMLFLKRGLGA